MLVADVCSGGDAESADLRGRRVRNVVTIEVGCRQHSVLIRTGDDLLEDAVSDAVVHHQLLLPRAVAVGGIDALDHALHFGVERVAEVLGSEFQSRFHHLGVLFDGEAGILVLVVDDPAFALRDQLVAEFLRGQFVAPLAESPFGELLNVALVDDGYRLLAILQRVLNGHAHQTLRPSDGNRLDADPGIFAYPLVSAGQHFGVQEVNEFLSLRSALLPLDPGVDVFCVLTKQHDIHAFGMFYRRGYALVVLHRTDAGLKIEDLPQGDVERTNAAADRRGQGALDSNPQLAKSIDCFVGKPGLESIHGFLAGEYLVPGNAALAPVGSFNRGIEHPNRRLPNDAPGAITFDEWNDGLVRENKLAIFVCDLSTAGR